MNIQHKYLTKNEWSCPQSPMDQVLGIVIHWINAPGQEAINTWGYFESLKNQKDIEKSKQRYGSAQFIIGLKGEVIQTMDLKHKAYAVGLGGFDPQPLYQSKFKGSPNRHTISIECAHIDNKGTMTKETYSALFELVLKLLKDYNLTAKDLYLHHDITTKPCHKWFVDNPQEWQNFKQAVSNMLNKN